MLAAARRPHLQATAALPAQNPVAIPATVSPPVAVPRPAESRPAGGGTDARLVGDEKRPRLVVDLAGPTAGLNFHAFILADPYRVVIDLPEIAFDVPPEA